MVVILQEAKEGQDLKLEVPNPKSERNSKSEVRGPNERDRTSTLSAPCWASLADGFRTSVFGLLSGFEDSGFGFQRTDNWQMRPSQPLALIRA
ncbi:MAG: hypothetical protein NTW03_00915 [Verrucomicrobia bacterium]|nr:hypothetical protein [Verrucomicrobiota bacterium]